MKKDITQKYKEFKIVLHIPTQWATSTIEVGHFPRNTQATNTIEVSHVTIRRIVRTESDDCGLQIVRYNQPEHSCTVYTGGGATRFVSLRWELFQ